MRLPAMSLAVVGVAYANRDKSNRRFEIKLCKPGDPVELRPEPKNPADPSAVAVFSERGIQLGYLSAERCGRIGAIIRSGVEVRGVFQLEADFGAWIRVAFDGEVPVVDLTATASLARADIVEGADPDPEFEPDPLWDD